MIKRTIEAFALLAVLVCGPFALANGDSNISSAADIVVEDAAQDFLCVVRSMPARAALELDTQCPIGGGLWGMQPKSKQSTLWIQCRYDAEPLSNEAYALLYANVSQTIVEQHDGKAYRCLIGPYRDHQQALLEKRHLQQYSRFTTAFLREVPTTALAKSFPSDQN